MDLEMHDNLGSLGAYSTMHDQDEDSSDTEGSASSVHLARKKRKPLMEKKRRARINASLEQLKKLVLDAMKKDSARYSKLEKADILELTVRHLREGQQQQMNAALSPETAAPGKYQDGFAECAAEVGRYLGAVDGLRPEVRLRLMQHLTSCVQKVELSSAKLAQMSAQQQQQQQQHQQHMLTHLPPQAPLQIQIPVATPTSGLPGSSRYSPEPGNLPPTPPSSAERSYSFSLLQDPALLKHSYATQVPQQFAAVASQPYEAVTSSGPLKSTENVRRAYQNRYSPYGMKVPVSVKREGYVPANSNALKEESMWRPW